MGHPFTEFASEQFHRNPCAPDYGLSKHDLRMDLDSVARHAGQDMPCRWGISMLGWVCHSCSQAGWSGLQISPEIDTFTRMKLQEIEREALALGESDRAALILSLMETLPAPGSDVGDDEALRRDEEMESGKVAPISHEEFVRRVGESRDR